MTAKPPAGTLLGASLLGACTGCNWELCQGEGRAAGSCLGILLSRYASWGPSGSYKEWDRQGHLTPRFICPDGGRSTASSILCQSPPFPVWESTRRSVGFYHEGLGPHLGRQ